MNNKLLATCLLLASCASEAAITLQAPPRNYGYTLGDVLTLDVYIDAEDGYRLDPGGIPQPGALNDWLQLRAADLSEDGSDGHDYRLRLSYQLFKSVPETVLLSLPELPLTFSNGRETRQQAVPAWSFYYMPLLPGKLAERDIPLQPAALPQPLDTGWHWRLLGLALSGAAALALALAWVYDLLPFLRRYQGPFGKACHTLQTLQRQTPNPDTPRQALQCLHQAVNAVAGETVLVDDLDAFLAKHPAYQAVREPLGLLYRRSARMFFAGQDEPEDSDTFAEVFELCRRCRKIERGGRWA